MVRRALICTTLVLLLIAPVSAHAMSRDQLQAQGDRARIQIGMDLIEYSTDLLGEQPDAIVEAWAEDCWLTTQRRGACVMVAEEIPTGLWCQATLVVRQRPSGQLVRVMRDLDCGEA